ncbi:MAG: energy transducer TonB [Candidatus Hydrogenedentota bacterium]|nr:MAG: energy transducer TonB [Candidatus Hydrogenedentota bacterium]
MFSFLLYKKKQKKEKIKTNKKNITSKKEAGKEESAFEKFFKTATTKKGTKSKKQDDFSFAKSKITGKKAKIGFPIAGKTGNYQNLSEGDIKGKTGDGKLPSEIPGGRTGLGKTGKGSIAGRKIIFKPKIPYPLYYRKKGIFGKAIVWVEVSPSGKVLRTRLKQSTGYPDLDILAERGVAKMLFSPVRKQVNDTGEIVVRFKLKR